MVEGERLEIEVDSMGEVEISDASFQNENDEFFVSEVFLKNHIGDDLRNIVFEIISVFAALNDGVDSFIGEEVIDFIIIGTVLVELVE